MNNQIINTKLDCGCKYIHQKGNSQFKYWIRCEEAERLWAVFNDDMTVDNRNTYHEHFNQYSHVQFDPIRIKGTDYIRFRIMFSKPHESKQFYSFLKTSGFKHTEFHDLKATHYKQTESEFIGYYHKPLGILILNHINQSK